MPCILLYVRRSKPDAGGESLDRQAQILHQFLDEHAEFSTWERVELRDAGQTGRHFDRSGIQTAFSLLARGEAHALLVKDLSRFGRNYLEVGRYLEDCFPAWGVRFLSISEGIDTKTSPNSQDYLRFCLENLLHALYSRVLSQKIKLARQSQAEAGKFLSAFAPYGYRKEAGQLRPDPETAPVVREIFTQAERGVSLAALARWLNAEAIPSPALHHQVQGDHFACPQIQNSLWRAPMLSRILQDSRYLGEVVYGKQTSSTLGKGNAKALPPAVWICRSDMHEALISQEIFQAVQGRFSKGKKKQRYAPARLQGHIRCGVCGHLLSPRRSAKHVRYRCDTPRFDANARCFPKSLLERDLLQLLQESLQVFSCSPAEACALLSGIQLEVQGAVSLTWCVADPWQC